MKFKFTLVVLLFSLLANAQVPGYMGKRCSIAYNLWVHPSIGGGESDFFGSGNPNDGLSLNTTHALELNYIVGQRTALSFTFQYAHLGLGLSDNGYYGGQGSYQYRGPKNYAAVLIEKGFSIGYKLFSRGKIAPVGSYIKWDLMGLFNTIKFETKDVYQYTNLNTGPYQYGYVPLALSIKKASAFGGGIALSLGRQRVFFNKLITDVGFRFCLAVAGDPYVGNYYQDKYLISWRVFYNQAINFKIGIGFLAF